MSLVRHGISVKKTRGFTQVFRNIIQERVVHSTNKKSKLTLNGMVNIPGKSSSSLV